jgi:hypothetical protein
MLAVVVAAQKVAVRHLQLAQAVPVVVVLVAQGHQERTAR